MINRILFLFILCYLPSGYADTIYQWHDEWGQLQYSKTPVPGSMISDLTELPVVQALTEEQKQLAMYKKMQEMRQTDFLRQKKKSRESNLAQQRIAIQNYCANLNNTLMDIRIKNTASISYLGNPYYWDGYSISMENIISRKIRQYCR